MLKRTVKIKPTERRLVLSSQECNIALSKMVNDPSNRQINKSKNWEGVERGKKG